MNSQLRQMQKALAGKVMIMTDERDHIAWNGMLGQESETAAATSRQVEVGQQVSKDRSRSFKAH